MSTRPKSLVGPTKPIDRRIRGIGRIRERSGLPDGPQWRAMNDMVTLLARDEEGRNLLREVFDERLKIDVLWTHYKHKTLHLIPLGTAATPLVKALEDWREQMKRDVSADTYRVRRELVEEVRKMAPPRHPPIVASLPDYVRVLRVQMKGARSFNLLRAYALAFVRDTLGKQSAVYAAVQGVTPRKTKPKVRKHPLSPAELFAVVDAFYALDGEWTAKHSSPKATKRPMAHPDDLKAMAYTGMNPSEYVGKWTEMVDRIRIYGTKRAGRVRDVPRFATMPLQRPSVTPRVFGKALRAASKKAGIPCTPYDLRRTYANWLEAAGIPRTRRRGYLGHTSGDITDLYERHEVDAYLVEDGRRLRAWLDSQLHPEAAPNLATTPPILTISRPLNKTARA